MQMQIMTPLDNVQAPALYIVCQQLYIAWRHATVKNKGGVCQLHDDVAAVLICSTCDARRVLDQTEWLIIVIPDDAVNDWTISVYKQVNITSCSLKIPRASV